MDESQVESTPISSNSTILPELGATKSSELGTSVGANAIATPEGTTTTTTPTIMPRMSDYTIQTAKDCTLYQSPPEIRKEIFKAVLDLFFQEFRSRKEIYYTLDMYGKQFVQPSTPHGFQLAPRQDDIVFAGLWAQLLPTLELALFADTKLHGEFITARIEQSTLTLDPKIVPNYQLGYGYDYVAWPQVDKISLKVRSLVRSVTYMLE
jgi:hypothetical protein